MMKTIFLFLTNYNGLIRILDNRTTTDKPRQRCLSFFLPDPITLCIQSVKGYTIAQYLKTVTNEAASSKVPDERLAIYEMNKAEHYELFMWL